MGTTSAGAKFRGAVAEERPVQCVGTINAYHARLAQRCGYRTIYLSGEASRPDRWGCRTSASARSTMC